MENRVKERLTGAIILVAAMVILVPEMFSGHRSSTAPAPGTPPRPATEGPPLRSYTMERDATAPVAPVAGTPTVAPAAEKPAELPPAQTKQEPAIIAMPAREAAPAREHTPQPAPPVAIAQSAGEESFYVQVGSFSKPDNAQRYALEISRKGFAARVDRGGKGNLLRVRVGPVAGRAAALALREQLAAKGYKGALTAP